MWNNQDEAGKRGIAVDLAGTAGARREHAGIAGNVMYRAGSSGVLGNTREPPGKRRISDEQQEKE